MNPSGYGMPSAIAAFASAASAQSTVPAADPVADDATNPYALPDAPAPPTLPDLTHRALAGSMESTFASIRGNTRPDGSEPGRSFGWTERLEVEQAVSIRRWYVGVSEQFALGKAQDGNFLMVAGNPEVWGRALWASQAGLAYGGGLGALLPPVHHGADGTERSEAIPPLRPGGYVDFGDASFIFRPFY